MLDWGRGRTKTGRLSSMRPGCGHGPGLNRRRRSTCSHRTEKPRVRYRTFQQLNGVLHVDGYAGFERLTAKGDIVLAVGWAHTL
ncbi:MAG: hypothetical protein E5V49_13045 [Mesorhizobium sp.]|nr:MAG: hypothetical protein E5V48_11155 [Mesorhizobium sp.]TJW32225.1 MAG: hypothetical protein E5V49_13045 [Mesorhizobium sp.]